MRKSLFYAPVAAAILLAAALPGLRVSQNRRFVETTAGQPFFWLGDTGWLMFQKLDRAETERYLEDRRAKGFNVIQCMILHEASNRNYRGAAALVNGDPAHPNAPGGGADYWEHVDWVADTAEAKGIYLAMVPAWGSIARKGTLNAANAESYARFLAARYGKRRNVVWLNGGDTHGNRETDVWRLIGRTLRERAPEQLITFHPFGRTQSSTWFHTEPWLDFNMFQSGHRRYDQDPTPGAKGEDNYRYALEDYALQPVKPTLDGEPSYEGIPQGLHDWKEPLWKDHDVRRYAYWSVFGGAFGHTYGHASIMAMRKQAELKPGQGNPLTWLQALEAPGAAQMQHLKKLMLTRSYFDRVPDQSLLAGDQGTRHQYIAATRGAKWAAFYVYTGRTFTVNMASAGGGASLRASWFDPRTGGSSPLGTFPGQGERSFDPPGQPEPGNDWVLVLDAVAQGQG